MKSVKLWRVMVAAVICWGAVAGFWQNLSADNEETYKELKQFSEVIDIIKKNYVEETTEKDLIEKAIQGMVEGLDPHSAFLPPEALEELQVDTQGEFGGIGIEIATEEGVLTVIAPIEGTPAFLAGIQAGDKIIKVDGELTKDLKLWEAVKKMRGPKGTKLTITIFREGVSEPMDFELVRDTIPIESVRLSHLQEGFGYIWVTGFREKTTEELTKALETLESEKTPLKGLILDLRGNPGGLLDQAVNIADIFLEEGTIVSMKGRSEQNQREFKATPNNVKRDYPIIVLINNGSASASEIVAGALQDHKRAMILGTTSFGKGSVQNVEVLRDGYGLKLTIARYYTPSGKSIQAEGIVPDIVVQPQLLEKKPEDDNKSIVIKEKDLKNHLKNDKTESDKKDGAKEEEKSDEGADKDSDKTDKTDAPDETKVTSSRGPIDPERLRLDGQVMRALEILVGYNIFNGITG